MVLCLKWLINVSFLHLLGRGCSYHPGHYICFYDMKGRHKASLLTATRKLENIFWWRAGLDMMQDAADLSVSFDLLGFYLPSITSSLRYWGLDYYPMAYHLLSVLYWCAQIWVMCVHTIVLLIARIHTRYNRLCQYKSNSWPVKCWLSHWRACYSVRCLYTS